MPSTNPFPGEALLLNLPRAVGEAAPLLLLILHRGPHPPRLLLGGVVVGVVVVVDGVGGDHRWLSLRRPRGVVEGEAVVVVPILGLNPLPLSFLNKLVAVPQLP